MACWQEQLVTLKYRGQRASRRGRGGSGSDALQRARAQRHDGRARETTVVRTVAFVRTRVDAHTATQTVRV